VNGAGKTTQLQIITGALQPDSGVVLKEKPNMKIAYLTQEFDVVATRTVRYARPPHPAYPFVGPSSSLLLGSDWNQRHGHGL
jgi:ABC-type hemin transport system ATPase subunit